MKIIYYISGNIKPEENAKHVINFFGVLGCIRVNARSKNPPKEQESKLVKHYFDYPYFSRIVNPEFFQKELNDEEKKFARKIVLHMGMFCYIVHCFYCIVILGIPESKIKKGTYRTIFYVFSTIDFGYHTFCSSFLMGIFLLY